MSRSRDSDDNDDEDNEQPTTKKNGSKEEPSVQIVETEITLSLINRKLNIINENLTILIEALSKK